MRREKGTRDERPPPFNGAVNGHNHGLACFQAFWMLDWDRHASSVSRFHAAGAPKDGIVLVTRKHRVSIAQTAV